MVAVIDPDHPGQLTLATEPCDPEVPGVISGANGVRPGMLMGQRATAADGDRDVDPAGRFFSAAAYCGVRRYCCVCCAAPGSAIPRA